MPIIGEIAHHKMMDREVVIGEKDRSVIAEQFRVTRTNLQYFITDKKVRLFWSLLPWQPKAKPLLP